MQCHDFIDTDWPEPGSRVLVGMSGGVDSTLTAMLLKQHGCIVTGVTMRSWDPENGGAYLAASETLAENQTIEQKILTRNSCYGPDEDIDISQCMEFCQEQNIPYHTVDVSKEYKQYVLDYFKEEYASGRTPNPCICCNQFVKFGALLDGARKAGIDFDYFCTGHYARVVTSPDFPGVFFAAAGKDTTKDQSYFLYRIPSAVLAKVRFPLGNLRKTDAKQMAVKLQLKAVLRPESQDFIPQSEWKSIFREEKVEPGDIVDTSGKVVGKHRGIIYYTVGQRRGLGVSAPESVYVQAIDRKTNRIIVAKNSELDCTGLEATSCVWPSGMMLSVPFEADVKIRLATPPVRATVVPLPGNAVKVIFNEPVRAVAPGQSAVFYCNNVILGGGFISRSLHE